MQMLKVRRSTFQTIIYISFQVLVHSKSLHFITIIKEELLISAEFQNPTITSADVQGWSYNTLRKCERSEIVEYTGQIFGIFSQDVTLNKKTYSSLLPHWSALVRLDLMLYGSVDESEKDNVEVQIENNPKDAYTKQDQEGYLICSISKSWIKGYFRDQVYPYQKNITHTANSLTLQFYSQFRGDSHDSDYEGYGFKHLSVYIDICYEVCSECSGPTPAQCKSCITGATLVNNICKCSGSKVAHNFQCIDSCPLGYIVNIDTGICGQSRCQETCGNCLNNICTICNSPYKLLQGECVSSCPSYSVDKGTYCEDKITGLAYGGYIFKGLYSQTFGDSGIQGEGLTLVNFKKGGATFSSCNGQRIIGGWNVASSGSEINRDLPSIDQNKVKQINRKPHWSIRIGFKYYMIDDWSSTDSLQVYLDNSKLQSTITKSQGVQGKINCGISDKQDTTGFYDLNMTHTGSSLKISIKSVIADNKNEFQASFGIREFYILIDYCQLNCNECEAKGCTKFSQGSFLYNFNCGIECPTGYGKNTLKNTCDLCGENCNTCDISDVINVQNLTQDVQYSHFEIFLTIKGGSINCIKCASGFYLYQNQCLVTCPPSTYPSKTTKKI